ncbi:uncharacterized membrane protein YgaE (UPF0421/DUF939 family) [Blastococcus colisei]|uniref:Uncharacterized membrane protein YgaE (UPF0421/DUF939 family) n=1 Tax=Blastococcus colisei TaxID=1564162 RepID=A0A543P223_9ACTN|nr:hypothetical protein [Blastococcus colisei]TQN38147.1 uncharacterized membrane protein YgaE (UPF0421/DUF939 family) [Blastococcus colisei]
MKSLWTPLHRPAVQRGIRAALAAGIAWQIAVLLPAPFSDYAYYAPLGAIIACLPTVADSASVAWRTVLAILLGGGIAVGVYEIARPVPTALTLALVVAVAIGVEQWRVLGSTASWVSVAALFTLTLGNADDPTAYLLPYAAMVLFGSAVGVLITTLLFPPLQLTQARQQIDRVRELLAEHLEQVAGELRRGDLPTAEQEERRVAALSAPLDRMRDAERTVERARRANPRARKWQEPAARLRAQSRSLDRVAVLADDLTILVAEYRPQHQGGERPELGTAERLADALDGLAGVVRTPDHDVDAARPDDRDHRIDLAQHALDNLTDRLRRTTVDDDPGFLALAAVAVGVQRALLALDAERRKASPT